MNAIAGSRRRLIKSLCNLRRLSGVPKYFSGAPRRLPGATLELLERWHSETYRAVLAGRNSSRKTAKRVRKRLWTQAEAGGCRVAVRRGRSARGPILRVPTNKPASGQVALLGPSPIYSAVRFSLRHDAVLVHRDAAVLAPPADPVVASPNSRRSSRSRSRRIEAGDRPLVPD